MGLSKEQQIEFERTVKEVANIAGLPVTDEQSDDPLWDTVRGLDKKFEITTYTIHQLSVISYVSERLPACLPKMLDLYPDYNDHSVMLVYAESLDRDDLKTISLPVLSNLRIYTKDYQAALYLYTVGGGTHDMYNVDTQLLTRDNPANILDIPVLNNQPLTADNYINVISHMRDIVYKRYYKYIEDSQRL